MLVRSLQSLTLDDLRKFHREHFTQSNLIIGIAGGYPKGFLDRVKADFAKLPKGTEEIATPGAIALRRMP